MKIIEQNERLIKLCEEMITRLPRSEENDVLIKEAKKLIKETKKLNIGSVIVEQLSSALKNIVNSKQLKSMSDNIIESTCKRIVGGKNIDKKVEIVNK